LEKISEHGTSFAAVTSLVLSLGLRPLAIKSTPDVEKENKHYAMSNSICSGLMKFAIVESVALPIEHAVKEIDKNKEKYLSPETLKKLSPKAYKLITQSIKLSVGFLTAIPKSMLTVALIPVVMGKLFGDKNAGLYSQNNELPKQSKSPAFTGMVSYPLSKIIENKKIQKLAIKYQNNDKDIAKHLTAGTDILLTASAVHQVNRSKDIKENRKKALIYNNIISTFITIAGGYFVDSLAKGKTNKFIEKFKKINASDPKLSKYIEGINIIRPALIFATIYYGILPMFSTYMAQKIDDVIKNKTK
jgi:hypothetical protein